MKMSRSTKNLTLEATGVRRRAQPALVIGLVNNVEDLGLRTTERQFRELLAEASQSMAVRLRIFALSEFNRSATTQAYVDQYYEDISNLWTEPVDGLIVTGRQPTTLQLTDEFCWPTLTKLFNWAQESTASTIWSCLAAHAAVLHASRIIRHPFREKLSGVYTSTKVIDHPLLNGIPQRWRIPQSRYNGLREHELRFNGYEVLSRSSNVDPDIFIRDMKSLFVYVQGHPEYEPHSLLREYRRDVAAFLAGENERYPKLPQGYFDRETAAILSAFRQKALRDRDANLLTSFPLVAAEGKLDHSWHKSAVRFYFNWLSCIAAQKAQQFDLVKLSSIREHT